MHDHGPALELAEHHRILLDMTVPQALAYASDRWGSRPAIVHVDGGPTLSWSELRTAVLQLSSGMLGAGVSRGDKIGVLLRNQVEYPLTWLAAAQIGAAIVPLNPSYTEREIEFVLNDAGASWLVASGEAIQDYSQAIGPVPRERVFAVGVAPVGVRSFSDIADAEICDIPWSPGPDDVVNIQFTSGTTGLPKGCLLSNRYWLEFAVYAAAVYQDPQRVLGNYPFYYVGNQMAFAIALAGGGALYVTQGLSRKKFMSWLVDYGIDWAIIDEGLLSFEPGPQDSQLKLKQAVSGGLPKEVHRAIEDRFHLKVRELYASTEVGNGMYGPWECDDMVGTGSMGYCFPNRESKIVDSEFNELPPDRAGELCVRGPGMMLGYHNRPEVNAELFLPGGWFRTGDVVRKDAAGRHFYEGRVRDMVRRSGESIASAEVEQQILAMPGVEEVGVIPVPDPHRGEEVKAIVVLRSGAAITAVDVVRWCQDRLAAFKVPRYVEFRRALPHTVSGKVQKATLKAEAPFGDSVIDVTGASAQATTTPESS